MLTVSQSNLTTPREAAYLAVFHYLKSGTYVDDTLASLAIAELAQARHIAYGTIQRLLSLEALARQLTHRPSLSLKPKEKALLFTALYQAHFQQGSPLYAIANETLKLAKRLCHPTFVSFLNALLRAYAHHPPTLPPADSSQNLSIRYSYPRWFVEKLLSERGWETTLKVLELGNQPAPTMARQRGTQDPFAMVNVRDNLISTSASNQLYIQNVTPVRLIQQLVHSVQTPARILDLCAAPGGKLILAHDLFPNAALYANDVSEKRLELLRQNLSKYEISAQITCGLAQDYPTSAPFDLVILDVPCSNTGVLGKRPEARWRLSQSSLDALGVLQRQLTSAALRLLRPGGVLWYLTCSILKEENEGIVEQIDNGACVGKPITQLPQLDGSDGGFGCAIRRIA